MKAYLLVLIVTSIVHCTLLRLRTFLTADIQQVELTMGIVGIIGCSVSVSVCCWMHFTLYVGIGLVRNSEL
jgi:hypothetical protein